MKLIFSCKCSLKIIAPWKDISRAHFSKILFFPDISLRRVGFIEIRRSTQLTPRGKPSTWFPLERLCVRQLSVSLCSFFHLFETQKMTSIKCVECYNCRHLQIILQSNDLPVQLKYTCESPASEEKSFIETLSTQPKVLAVESLAYNSSGGSAGLERRV